MDKDFFVVDFEFTQYTKPTGKPRAFFSEIIEIGAVGIDCETLEITGHIEEFVKPHFFPKQAAESMEFCMITESDIASWTFGDGNGDARRRRNSPSESPLHFAGVSRKVREWVTYYF